MTTLFRFLHSYVGPRSLAIMKVARILLLEQGTDVNSRDISNWTSLAVLQWMERHKMVIRKVVLISSSVMVQTYKPQTSVAGLPLQSASRKGDIGTVLQLLLHGADANTRIPGTTVTGHPRIACRDGEIRELSDSSSGITQMLIPVVTATKLCCIWLPEQAILGL